jgi:peptide/nickel transport system permease protein
MGYSTRVLDSVTERAKTSRHATTVSAPDRRRPAATIEAPAVRAGIAGRLRADPTAYAALVLLTVIIVAAVAAPFLSPHSADAIDPAKRLLAPSPIHPFGTDDMGRDLFVRVMQGGRVSVAVGLITMVFAVLVGLAGGAVAGYLGGIADLLVMRLADLMLSIPVFLIVLLVSSLVSPGVLLLCVIIGAVQWMEVARVVRSVIVSSRKLEFVEAARALGASHTRIVARHLLPHTSAPVFVAGTLALAQAIMIESTLSFLGFGLQPPSASWGSLLNDAQGYLAVAPWIAVFPGLMIFATVLCCYVIGAFLKSALDPRGTFQPAGRRL